MTQLTKIEQDVREIKSYLSNENIKRELADNYIQMILKTNPQVTKSAVIEHLNLVQLSGANPYKKQVYFTSYFSKKLGHAVGSTVFSYRFFEDVANQTKDFLGCPCEVTVSEYFDPNKGEFKKTLKAVARATRKDREPIVFEAWYPEFVQTDRNGNPNSIWKEKPHVMLRKCAIAGALRSQFPETLGTFIIEEEFGDIEQEKSEKSAAIEVESKKVEDKIKQEKQIIENAKESGKKADVVEAIISVCKQITEGMTLNQKGEWMVENLKVQNFEQLKGKLVKDLRSLLEELQNKISEPVVVSDELPY